MKHFHFFLRAIVVVTVLLSLINQVNAYQPARVESLIQPGSSDNDTSPLKPRRIDNSPTPTSISISNLVSEKKAVAETVSHPGTPHQIGFGRDVPQLGSDMDTANYFQWRNTSEAGNIAAISITSQQAVGIRLGILVHHLPAEAILRFYSQGAETAYEISGKEIMKSIKQNLDAGDGSDAGRTYWSPHIEGEEATLEIELPPGISTDTVEISIPRISHFFISPLAAPGGNSIKKIGDAASCEIDASCYSDWTLESKATARMSFVNEGSSYVCTGTLLNDKASSGTPYFLSANHCISKQTVASTLLTYWFYRSATCNSGTPNPTSKTLIGGATLLYASSATDTSFLKLNDAPPVGSIYAGWDLNAQALGTLVTGIHHPHGDLQKISFGIIESYKDCFVSDPTSGYFTCISSTQASAEYLNVTFISGITESGSSGSGLFKTSGGNHYLIGQLYGGTSSCSNQSGTNHYGRFDVAYNAALSQWLDAGTKLLLSISKLGNGSGTVTSVPSGINCGAACSASFAVGDNITLTATPVAGSTFTGWSGSCSGTSTSCLLANINANSSVTATFSTATISLGSALDNTNLNLVWATGGNAAFFSQTAISYYGGSAAQTGKITNSQSTYLSTSLTGPGTLSFYWKVSSELNYDIFSVYLDGVKKYYWSGNTSWYKSELTIPVGTHTVKWEYVKDSLFSSGQDAGWVDNVVFTPSANKKKTASDIDGDGKTDLVIWRPGDGWYVQSSSTGVKQKLERYGESTDITVPGDYDGDGKTDIAVWRPSDGMWYIIYSSTGQKVALGPWGTPTDIPVPGDYDGDGKTDMAVWRPSTGWWYIVKSSDELKTGQTGGIGMQWGVSTDIPITGDYDGDGITDFAVWRPSDGWWYIVRSSDGLRTGQAGSLGGSWGVSTDTPVPGDYDGDGKTDMAVWRPSTGWWYIINSSNGVKTGQAGSLGGSWGVSTDTPVPGDYDGDGKTDLAVWRPGDGWYIIRSSDSAKEKRERWGESGDFPFNSVSRKDFTTTPTPSTPTGFSVTPASSSVINLSWSASTGSVSGYKIYRGGTYLKTVTTTSTSDSGLNASTNYCYSLTAYNSAGESAQTSQLCATTQAPPVATDALIGNFKFVYQIISTFTDRITLDTKSSSKTSEGTYIYTGYDADYPTVTAFLGAWYPSLSTYIISTLPLSLYPSQYRSRYFFSINADNTLSGCYTLSSDYGNTWSSCFSFITASSYKSPLGSWLRSMESKNELADIIKVFEAKSAEIQESQVRQTESSLPAGDDLVSKFNELRAIIQNNQ